MIITKTMPDPWATMRGRAEAVAQLTERRERNVLLYACACGAAEDGIPIADALRYLAPGGRHEDTATVNNGYSNMASKGRLGAKAPPDPFGDAMRAKYAFYQDRETP